MKNIKAQPNQITFCYLQVVLMPNGEVINQGKIIGWFKNCKEFLFSAQAIAKSEGS